MRQKGFAPVFILIGVLIISALGATFYIKQHQQSAVSDTNQIHPQETENISPTLNPRAGSPTAKITQSQAKPTIKPTNKPSASPTPTSSPTQSASSSNPCPYILTGPTGAIKVDIKPRSGLVVGDQIVELQARSGCKVLDGRSTDKQTMIARAGGNGYSSLNSVSYSTVPEGPYSVRIQYKGQWTGYTDVNAVATQGRTVEIIVEGSTPSPTPTPTPKPKPICSVTVVPSSSGTAPYEASVCVGNNTNPYQAVQQEFVDYDGNGSWDYQGPSYGCHAYTFQNPGTYSPKAKIIGVSGEESDICQTSATIN
ncbi:MAG: hypothetical protein V1808_04045 [Candidatus Daviesbacteria bacterium]